MWLQSAAYDVAPPPPQRDFARENARHIRALAMHRRQKEAEEAVARAMRKRPLKATMAFADVKPRVTAYMNGQSKSKGRTASSAAGMYLQGHAKTGPFLDKGSSAGDYYNPNLSNGIASGRRSNLKKSQSMDVSSMYRLDQQNHSGMNGRHNGAVEDEVATVDASALTARFSEITVEERKARISDLVKEICDTPPLIEGQMVLQRRSPSFKRRSGSTQAISRLSNVERGHSRVAAEQAVKKSGIPAMSRNKSVSTTSLAPPPRKINGLLNDFKDAVSAKRKGTSSIAGGGARRNPHSPAERSEKTRSIVELGPSAAGSSLVVAGGGMCKHSQHPPESPAKSVHDELGLDAATKRELRLDLGGIEGSLDAQEDVQPQVQKSEVNSDFPVVKGVCVDYVHANRDGAFVIGGQQRRLESSRSRASSAATGNAVGASGSAPSTYKTGRMPKYLVNRKEKWRLADEKREREKPDPDCPTGQVRLSEDERLGLLKAVEERTRQLIDETNRLPVRSDTMRSRNRRKEMEDELSRLEDEIRKYSRHVVYVHKGLKTVAVAAAAADC
jgi:hypothetical protein